MGVLDIYSFYTLCLNVNNQMIFVKNAICLDLNNTQGEFHSVPFNVEHLV